MLFNSIDFALFLPVVFILYWLVNKRNLNIQNCLIVVASYVFYGWWDWKFLLLIFFSTITDYFLGIWIHKEKRIGRRKALVWTSVFVNIGFLAYFKYYDFFIDNFLTAFSFFGIEMKAQSLNIILPVGISFYTFQTLSYTIDIYKKKLQPSNDFIAFAAFVSFFPQLVAGPIERASKLLPQFTKKRVFEYHKAIDGLRQILWGLFKKIVIADNCAHYANMFFDQPENYGGSTLLLGAIFFTFQIYCDFSGYSDIAIGTARLFGISLSQNFATPYFSRDFAEAWRRWHITLSSWFRDYLFIPLLRKSKAGIWMKIASTFILFLVIGFWHGANWTFIAWGFVHALFFLPTMFRKNKQANWGTVAKGKNFPSLLDFLKISKTFGLIVLSMILFRSESINNAWLYFSRIISPSLFTWPEFSGKAHALSIIVLLLSFLIIEWVGRERQYAISHLGLRWKRPFRWALYSLLIFFIGMFMQTELTPFIYFQF